MSKNDKKPLSGKEVKKVDEKPRVNIEELIVRNLAEPKMSIDKSGYHFTHLNLSVCLIITILRFKPTNLHFLLLFKGKRRGFTSISVWKLQSINNNRFT